MKSSGKTRFIIGALVTESMGTPSVYRNPMCAYAFARTIFNGQEPEGLDMTLTLEDERRARSEGGGFEIVSGTIDMMRASLAAFKKPPASEKSSSDPPAMTGTTFIQVCIGSKEFADLFVRLMSKMLGQNGADWEPRLLAALSATKPTDVIWVDIMKKPYQISRIDGPEMMRKNISAMVA